MRRIYEDSEHSGSVAVVLPVPLNVAQAYALNTPGAEAPEGFHMTLLYLGKDISAATVNECREAVAAVAKEWASFGGSISGYGRFFAPEKDPIYLSVDAVGLSAFREAIRKAAPKTPQNHGFTPHVTVAYVPKDEETPLIKRESMELRFSSVELWIGDTHETFPLTGTMVAESAPVVESTEETETMTLLEELDAVLAEGGRVHGARQRAEKSASQKQRRAKKKSHSALVKKLSQDPNVRDAEALAAWIGARAGGLAPKTTKRAKSVSFKGGKLAREAIEKLGLADIFANY